MIATIATRALPGRWFRPSMRETEIRLRDRLTAERRHWASRWMVHRDGHGSEIHIRGLVPAHTDRHGHVTYVRLCAECRRLTDEARHYGELARWGL